MQDVIQTPRLLLRPLTIEDAPTIFALNSDPEVMRYLPKDEVYTSEAEATHFLRQYLDRGKESRFARCAVVRKTDGQALGWCGLKEDETGEVDLGYRLLPEYWEQGYGIESSISWLAYGFGTAGLKRIVARAADENTASQAVLVKLGFTRLPEEDHEAEGFRWGNFVLIGMDGMMSLLSLCLLD